MYMNKKQHSMLLIDHYKMYLFFTHNLILNYISLQNLSVYYCNTSRILTPTPEAVC